MSEAVLPELPEKKPKAVHSDKLGTHSVPKLIVKMSLPAILSMLVQALYNIVDSIYISRDSQKGLSALNTVFAMQILMNAFAIGIGVGINSCVARKLGEGKRKEASRIAQTGVLLSSAAALLFILVGALFSKKYMSAYETDVEIIEMGATYLTVVYCCGFGIFFETLFNKIVQATGNMIVPMAAQLAGALTNIALDPLFIFVFDMGVLGAAVATVIGTVVAMLIGLFYLVFSRSGKEVDLNFRGFRLDSRIFLAIAAVSVPVIVMNSIGSVTILSLNKIVQPYTQNGKDILTLYLKLQAFVFMPVFGLNQGTMPILGYNYGAGNKKRFITAFRTSLLIAVGMTIAGFLIFQLAPRALIGLFSSTGSPLSESMISEAAYAFRIIGICFIPAGICIVTVALFNSIGHGIKAMAMNLTRQLILIIPLTIMLGALFGAKGLWFNYSIAEFIVAAVFFPMAVYTVKRLFPAEPTAETAEGSDEPGAENTGSPEAVEAVTEILSSDGALAPGTVNANAPAKESGADIK